MRRSAAVGIAGVAVALCCCTATAKNVGVDIYLPDNLAAGERLRGMWGFFNMPNADQFVDDPLMRDFANRARFMLFRMGSDSPDRAGLAGATGHPEIAYIPVVRIGHSAGGTNVWLAAQNDPMALAAIGHNHWMMPGPGQVDNLWSDFSDASKGKVPLLINSVDADFPSGSRATKILNQVCKAVAAKWNWSCDMGFGASHMGREPEEIRLMTYWVEDVAAMRIPDPLPSGSFSLKPVDASKAWLCHAVMQVSAHNDWKAMSTANGDGSLGAVPDLYTKMEKMAYSSVTNLAPGTNSGYVWMPSERVADMWIKYHTTGNIWGKTDMRQTNAWHTLGDNVDYLGNMPYVSWHCASYRMLNIPGFTSSTTDYLKVRWSVSAGALPPGMTLSQYGAVTKCAIAQAGTYTFTLKATFNDNSFEQVHYLPVRGAYAASPVIKITEPANLSTVRTLPLTLKWTSSMPLGYLRCHSSLDGEISEEARSLGSGGSITINALSPGQNTITLLGYSAPPTVQREAETVVLNVGPVAVGPDSHGRPAAAAAVREGGAGFAIDGKRIPARAVGGQHRSLVLVRRGHALCGQRPRNGQ